MSDRRILIVDDEPDMVENCTRILRRAGYRVLATTDPERALWSYLRQLLERHHGRHHGNISAAAKAAGIDRKTFRRLVTKHGIR